MVNQTKVCLLLPLALVLLAALCVSADRAYVEKIKGAPKNSEPVKVEPQEAVNSLGIDVPAVDDVGVRDACTDCWIEKCAVCFDPDVETEACLNECYNPCYEVGAPCNPQ